jgi:hypothetical protein
MEPGKSFVMSLQTFVDELFVASIVGIYYFYPDNGQG